MSDGPVIVKPCDLRPIKGCVRGAKAFCDKHESVDWRAFVENRLEAETLEATGDTMAIRLAAQARKRTEAERGRR